MDGRRLGLTLLALLLPIFALNGCQISCRSDAGDSAKDVVDEIGDEIEDVTEEIRND
ncbi:MAG: hypothetical protein IPK83_16275 [Planctomycetes bacterium]|nr:hypothetical protein [Planctomycetota bacterium]